jgi:hypothetical protein
MNAETSISQDRHQSMTNAELQKLIDGMERNSLIEESDNSERARLFHSYRDELASRTSNGVVLDDAGMLHHPV